MNNLSNRGYGTDGCLWASVNNLTSDRWGSGHKTVNQAFRADFWLAGSIFTYGHLMFSELWLCLRETSDIITVYKSLWMKTTKTMICPLWVRLCMLMNLKSCVIQSVRFHQIITEESVLPDKDGRVLLVLCCWIRLRQQHPSDTEIYNYIEFYNKDSRGTNKSF